MRAFFFTIALLTFSANSQIVPQAFNYQGIARDIQGNSLGAKSLSIKITLQEKSGNTTTDVYSEAHTVTTNAFGLFNLSIGKGTPSLGTFSSVAFANKNISVKTDIDPNGGNNYTLTGSSELLSVPYALVAGNTATSNNYWNKNDASGLLYVNNGEKVGIGTQSPTTNLDLVGTAKFSTLTSNNNNTRLLTADASGNLSYRDLSTISSLSSVWSKNSTSNAVYVNNTEKVGIGTSEPNHALEIVANEDKVAEGFNDTRQLLHIRNSNSGSLSNVAAILTAGPEGTLSGLHLGHNSPTYFNSPDVSSILNLDGKGLTLGTWSSVPAPINFAIGTPSDFKMTIAGNGNVGIGTIVPAASLDLVGTAKFGTLPSNSDNTRFLTADDLGNLSYRDLASISALGSPWTKNDLTNTVYADHGERVGIGTNTPTQMLHLEAYQSGPDREFVRLHNTSPENDCVTSMNILAGETAGFALIQHSNTYDLNPSFAGITSVMTVGEGLVLNAAKSTGFISLMTSSTGFEYERMRINADGNIGIGTSTPKAKLEVSNGDIYVSDATKGVVLTSANGQCWRLTVSNTGALTTVSTPCP